MKKHREDMVKRRFREKVAELLPHFEAACFGENWSDLLCYRWRIGPGLTSYVTLRVDENDDRFHVLLAWLLTDRPPIFATPGTPDSQPNRDGLSIDLSLLWSRNAVQWKVKYSPSPDELSAWLLRHPEFNDRARDEEERKVLPRVDDAVQRALDFGFPYLRAIADRYAIPWPSASEV
jgi:hypothetical protein